LPQWALDILTNFAHVTAEMSPYLLFGFLAAGALSVLVSPEFIERNLGGRGILPVLKASALGVPLPLCSCSVIPVAASIRRHGAGRGATTAFLVSTPQTGVDSIAATFSLLGPIFAVFRPVVAFASGLIGGAAVSMTGANGPAAEEKANCEHACCSGKDRRGAILRILRYSFVTLPRDIGPALLVGLSVAALITSLVPEGFFSELVPPGPLQILVLMLAGIPVYICATASIPVAAGLIVAGVSPGAAFALLMTGPATNAATLTTVWRVLGRRTCVLYLLTMMVAAFGGGMLLDSIITSAEVREAVHHAWIPSWLKTACAIILVAVLCCGICLSRKGGAREHEGEKHDAA
jgi:uncharacterized membrane protein YraQ (UPF0718 family)